MLFSTLREVENAIIVEISVAVLNYSVECVAKEQKMIFQARLSLFPFIFTMAYGFSPYTPSNNITYYLEGARGTWPACQYRFLSYPTSCDSVDLWSATGPNQEWTLIDSGRGTFFLRSSCGQYLSYSSDCSSHIVDMWPEAGINQEFMFVVGDNSQFEYYLESAGRSSCDYRFLSFGDSCSASHSDSVDLWLGAGENQRFLLHPVHTPLSHTMNSVADRGCADPYVWFVSEEQGFALQCTGDNLPLSFSESLAGDVYFRYKGESLGGTPPAWAAAAGDNRWAPENLFVPTTNENYCFFSDTSPADGMHRIGLECVCERCL